MHVNQTNAVAILTFGERVHVTFINLDVMFAFVKV